MKVFAPAKVNLALHVTGKRADGYHLLDSLVVFAGVFDWLTVEPASEMSVTVTGPKAEGVPTDARNLVWRAAEWAGRPSHITLEKHLPQSAGIGGGSTDAASVLIALGCGPDGSEALGADVPVCWHRRPCRMSGIGEVLEEVPDLPLMWMVLVNAGVAVPTGVVFQMMEDVDNAALPTPEWNDFDSFITWLATTRNDMEAAAKTVSPVIFEVLERLAQTEGCALARMSGSGGTCFGLYATEKQAEAAAASMPSEWWAEAALVMP
ncbi:4-(cytidine 5'-diphospho)-2-C-methyl-D-erythritol kinase [Jannaschia sp. EhC01]|nr:4-(cytidine 5'-diphospho)-2-C-methyl-D-erythritol kinase [Jannaschia sp. EhC01]